MAKIETPIPRYKWGDTVWFVWKGKRSKGPILCSKCGSIDESQFEPYVEVQSFVVKEITLLQGVGVWYASGDTSLTSSRRYTGNEQDLCPTKQAAEQAMEEKEK